MPPICRPLGLNLAGQRRKIQEHDVLLERSTSLCLPSLGSPQDTLCIRLDALKLWLARVKPDKRRDPSAPSCS